MNRKELNSFKESVYKSLLNERYRYANSFVPPTGDPVLDQELRDAGQNSQIPLPSLPPQLLSDKPPNRPQFRPKNPYGPGYNHYDISTPWWNNPGWEVPYPIRPNTRPYRPGGIRFA